MSRRYTGPEKPRRRGGRARTQAPVTRPQAPSPAPPGEEPAERARRLAREAILGLLKSSRRGFKSRSLYNLVGRPLPYPEFRQMLGELLDGGVLRRDELRRWCATLGLPRNTGTLVISPSGYGHVLPDDGGPRVFIPRNGLGRYLQDDRVEIEIHPGRRGPGPEGRIVRLIERRMSHVIGTLVRYSRSWLLVPESARFGGNITITGEVPPEAEDGKVVRAELLPETDGRSGALIARVERVLGDPGTPHVMQEAVKAGFNLRTSFPAPVLVEAEALDLRQISQARDREDLTGEVVFTIDPPDARDFDDAVSIHALEDGGWELAVHIADVSHFVPADSALDKEAYKRGCSVYLVGEVVPMLPHRLSSDLCSLVEGEDRLCFSAFMRFSARGVMKKARFATTRIRSRRRFSYQQVQEVLEGFPRRKPAGFTPETAWPDDPVMQSLWQMDRLWRILKRNRLAKGGLDFSIPEPVFTLDASGHPLAIQTKSSREANFLIEEFMLAANRAVAEALASHGRLCIHRVHEAPSGDKLDRFVAFLEHLGPEEIPPLHTVAGWQQIVKAFEGSDKSLLLQEVVLRSMMKARYDVSPLGHFGLGFQHYAHFTSPIRRYPDLVVHRLLKRLLTDRRDAPRSLLEEAARHSSRREIVAQEAERDSVRLHQLLWLRERIGEDFDGIVRGVESFGLFVELPAVLADGLLPVGELPDDRWSYDGKAWALVGLNSGRSFRVGQPIRVNLIRADLENRQVDFRLADEPRQRTNRLSTGI